MPSDIDVEVNLVIVKSGRCPKCRYDTATHMVPKSGGSDDYFVICGNCETQSRWSAWNGIKK